MRVGREDTGDVDGRLPIEHHLGSVDFQTITLINGKSFL
jgi:hypothetical protein